MTKPLYKQIIDDLVAAIESGQLPVGAKLPTEKELSLTYGVSRITSKRALTELETSGLITRTQGKGSYVQAQKINSSLTPKLLFLIPFANDLSLGNFNEGLAPVIASHHYDVVLSSTEFLVNKQAEDLMQEFSGMIYYAHQTDDFLDTLFELSLADFPVIILDKKIHDLSYPTIQSDNFAGGEMATTYLMAKGHQRIAYIFGETALPQSVRQRYLGYLHATKKYQLPFRTARTDQAAFLSDHTVDYLLSNHVTGVICENDLVAIALMKKAKQAQVAIPEALSVFGFDNIQAAALVDPPLSTIAQNFKQMGQLAGELLIQWIEQGQRPADQQIAVEKIIRHSTKERTHE